MFLECSNPISGLPTLPSLRWWLGGEGVLRGLNTLTQLLLAARLTPRIKEAAITAPRF